MRRLGGDRPVQLSVAPEFLFVRHRQPSVHRRRDLLFFFFGIRFSGFLGVSLSGFFGFFVFGFFLVFFVGDRDRKRSIKGVGD